MMGRHLDMDCSSCGFKWDLAPSCYLCVVVGFSTWILVEDKRYSLVPHSSLKVEDGMECWKETQIIVLESNKYDVISTLKNKQVHDNPSAKHRELEQCQVT